MLHPLARAQARKGNHLSPDETLFFVEAEWLGAVLKVSLSNLRGGVVRG